VANTPGNRLVTFFYGELDPASGELRYVNAGHNPPLLFTASGSSQLESTGLVLGVLDGALFEEAQVALPPGSRLLLFTDGITEAASPADEEFGEGRLEELVRGESGDEPGRLLGAVAGALARFTAGARQADDVTLMLVSRATA
jgi:serine phosphatase RsbU (regulator of sigma subunit)